MGPKWGAVNQEEEFGAAVSEEREPHPTTGKFNQLHVHHELVCCDCLKATVTLGAIDESVVSQ